MIFLETPLPGAWLIELEKQVDERGFFARSWCRTEFASRGLNPDVLQCNISFNRRRGTVRGMHFQRHPHEEIKLVRCSRGAIYDVIIDLRPDSPTRFRSAGFELTDGNHLALYVPAGFAHGFQTLSDDAEVFYQMSREYEPGSAAGLRWNDPAINLNWPLPISIIAPRDASYPDFPI